MRHIGEVSTAKRSFVDMLPHRVGSNEPATSAMSSSLQPRSRSLSQKASTERSATTSDEPMLPSRWKTLRSSYQFESALTPRIALRTRAIAVTGAALRVMRGRCCEFPIKLAVLDADAWWWDLDHKSAGFILFDVRSASRCATK